MAHNQAFWWNQATTGTCAQRMAGIGFHAGFLKLHTRQDSSNFFAQFKAQNPFMPLGSKGKLLWQGVTGIIRVHMCEKNSQFES